VSERRAWWWLAASLVVLFHSHHGAFLPTIVALALDSWRRGIPRASGRDAFLAIAIAVALIVPWFWILDVGQHHGALSAKEIRHHVQFYLRQLNHFVAPITLLLAAWIFRGLRPYAWWRSASQRQRDMVGAIALIVVCNLAFIATVPWQRHFRYLIHLLPLIYLLEALCLWIWLHRHRAWFTVVCALLITTDLLHYSAPYVMAQAIPPLRQRITHEHGLVFPRSLLAEYGYELTHRYRGPLEGIVEILRRSARPGDTVKIPYGDHAVIFYAELKVEDLNQFMARTYPDWIIPRRDWVPAEFFHSAYFQEIERAYRRIEVDAPDLAWENRPDPGYHKFKMVEDAPRIVMYHRMPGQRRLDQ